MGPMAWVRRVGVRELLMGGPVPAGTAESMVVATQNVLVGGRGSGLDIFLAYGWWYAGAGEVSQPCRMIFLR